MKEKYSLTILFIAAVNLLSFTANAQRYHVPDTAFQATLKTMSVPLYGLNKDSIDATDVASYTSLQIQASVIHHERNIKNIRGIEAFRNLRILDLTEIKKLDYLTNPMPRKLTQLSVCNVGKFDVTSIDSLYRLFFNEGADSILSLPDSTYRLYFASGTLNTSKKFLLQLGLLVLT
ncbi:MAG: hypothetical protein EXR21_04835 [Flavobacteriaceae bacterium]|nr:hypothetical protein [Flavobacteriaceae bacterium]